MALWTPYAEDVPMDLSKTAARETCTSEYFAPQLPVQTPVPTYPPCSGYLEPFGRISPGRSPSGYLEYDTVPYQPVPPPPRHATLSPPESLTEAAAERKFDMMDVDCLSDDPDFRDFESNALRVMAEKNGGALLGNNPRMRRAVHSSHSHADDAYRRQRERNNAAAKQSRDRRKLRELHMALKVTYLKREVAALKAALNSRVCGHCRQSCLC